MGIYNQIKNKDEAFIISEIGVNYYDIADKRGIKPIEAAKLMIDKAANNGTDAVKFQSYKADRIASENSPAYWDQEEEPTDTQYKLFKKYDKFEESEFKQLSNYCKQNGVIFMSTPFDYKSADYLNELMPIYKISSSDITNLPFIKYIAKKGKPIFLSTGAANLCEIEKAINKIIETGNKNICIMHCILDYPTNYNDANLNMIKHIINAFPGYIYGYSDHTKPDRSMMVLSTAYLSGAKVIEKHFTLDKEIKGNDHYHAMNPEDLHKFRNNIELIKKAKGQYIKEPLHCEKTSREQARRSIVADVNIERGEKITREKLTFKRPGTGISPAELNKIIGRKAKMNIQKDKIIKWELV